MDNTQRNAYHYLDLHGETKEKAVSKVVSFLDQIRHTQNKKRQNYSPKKRRGGGGGKGNATHNQGTEKYMVTIITGSGSHSNSGPVIRNAVERVLIKRQMTYNLTCKKGAFNVDAMSGIELWEEPVQDSKILVVDNHEFDVLSRSTTTANGSKAPYGRFVSTVPSQSRNTSQSSSTVTEFSAESGDNPLPSEVAAEDDNIAKVKEMSLREAFEEKSKFAKEVNELNEALNLSLKIESGNQDDEERMIAEAIRMSKIAADEEEQKMDQELKDILELSKKEANQRQNLEEETLNYAILLSKRQSMTNRNDYEGLVVADEEQMLQQALDLSKGL